MGQTQPMTPAQYKLRQELVDEYNRKKTKPSKKRVYDKLMELEECIMKQNSLKH